jgi:hypothetical protein
MYSGDRSNKWAYPRMDDTFREHEPSTTKRLPINTRTTWLMAWFPALATLVAIFPLLSGAGTTYTWLIAAAILSGSVTGVALATIDQQGLTESEFDSATSPWWGLVPVFYLFLRGNRNWLDDDAALKPAWAHAGVCTFIVFAVFVLALY